jgi:hypothetical protein
MVALFLDPVGEPVVRALRELDGRLAPRSRS